MRVSCLNYDRGYIPPSLGANILVTINDKTIDKVITADTRVGFVRYYKLNEDGQPLIDLEENIVATRFEMGHVVINEVMPDGSLEDISGYFDKYSRWVDELEIAEGVFTPPRSENDPPPIWSGA